MLLGWIVGLLASGWACGADSPGLQSNNTPLSRLDHLADPAVAIAPLIAAQPLWAQVFQLLRDANGVPSQAQFAGAFGATLRESLIGGSASFYGVNSEPTAYLDVALMHDRSIHRPIRARAAYRLDEQQACLSVAAASQDLIALGWLPGQFDARAGSFYSFSKRQGHERIFLYTTLGCVNRVSMSVA